MNRTLSVLLSCGMRSALEEAHKEAKENKKDAEDGQ